MTNHFFVHDASLWTKRNVSHRLEPAQVHSYKNAIVLPCVLNTDESVRPKEVYKGGVCSADFEFIAGCIRKHGVQHTNLNCDEAYAVPRTEIVYRDETVIFGGCLIGHFGHALLDSTARFWYLLNAPTDNKIVFLRYNVSNEAYFDALKFVELMGIDMDRVEVISTPTQFREVIVPDQAIYGVNAYRPEHVQTFEKIKSVIRPHTTEKIYLSRTQFNWRVSLNEQYYEDFFARRGYTVIHPETLPIEEQIAYISGADEIVTTMGSMAHLLLFAKPTVSATILNRSREYLMQQTIVNQVRNVEPYYIDAYVSPLPTANRGPFLFGPNRFFKAYLDERGISYDAAELNIDCSSLIDDSAVFLQEWKRLYVDEHISPGKYRKKDIFYCGEDYMQMVAQLVGDDADDPDGFLFTRSLRSKDAEIKKLKASNTKLKEANRKLKESNAALTADLKKSRSEVRHLRNSKSWKITAPLRRITELLGGKS